MDFAVCGAPLAFRRSVVCPPPPPKKNTLTEYRYVMAGGIAKTWSLPVNIWPMTRLIQFILPPPPPPLDNIAHCDNGLSNVAEYRIQGARCPRPSPVPPPMLVLFLSTFDPSDDWLVLDQAPYPLWTKVLRWNSLRVPRAPRVKVKRPIAHQPASQRIEPGTSESVEREEFPKPPAPL